MQLGTIPLFARRSRSKRIRLFFRPPLLLVMVLPTLQKYCRHAHRNPLLLPQGVSRRLTLSSAVPSCTSRCSRNIMPREDSQTCSNGIAGVEGKDTQTGQAACCPLTCVNDDGRPECGGFGCKHLEGGKNSCCVKNINRNGEACSDSNEAPCFISDSRRAVDGRHARLVDLTLLEFHLRKTDRTVGTPTLPPTKKTGK